MSQTKLSTKDIEHIAKLARLSLTDKEVNLFQHQLSDILKYVGQLQELNTKKVEPTSQVTGLEDIYVKDGALPVQTISQDAATAQAQQPIDGYVAVPQVIETE